jgi:hypothetical protein
LTALCQQEAKASISILYQFEFCTSATFAYLKFCHYLQTFLRDGIFEGSAVVERVQDLGYMVGGEEQSI